MESHDNIAHDLVWNLDQISNKSQAFDFLNRFEESLCVFSSAVSQLYASYKIAPVSNDRLVILPDPYAWHDTFQSISPKAVKGTGLFIIPGEAVGEDSKLRLMQRSQKTGKYKSVPLAQGIAKLKKLAPEDAPFLPVIMNKDLRELPNRAPLLHLHRLDVRELELLSEFQKKDICQTIAGKMDNHLLVV